MQRPAPARSRRESAPPRLALSWVACLHVVVLGVGWATRSPAIEFLDGRVQIHGFGETQIRSVARDFEIDDLDLTQWYLIANVEVELDILREGFGPIDLVGGFVRVEARYDCIWTRACALFDSVNTYGNRAERLPDRLSDAHKNTFAGTLDRSAVRIDEAGNTRDFRDRRRRIGIPLGQDSLRFAISDPDPAIDVSRPTPNRGHVGRLWNVPALAPLFFGLPGLDPNGVLSVDLDGDGAFDPIPDPGLGDDDISGCLTGNSSPLPCRYPGAYVGERFLDYRFGSGSTRGPTFGNSSTILGPWRPKDLIIGWGALRDRVNPYNDDALHPVMRDADGAPLPGAGDLPFRPRAEFAADADGDGDIDARDERGPTVSRGLYYPTSRLAAVIRDRDFDQPKINFDESDLAFNHGYAQEQTHELKEAYLDIELFDHALWLRAGRQTIVWGKTELFRSQDQFNPQDLGLSSLPSLEESRIPLWALRAIYSLYDVGPFADVRIEAVALIDQFQPLDFGRCGEPYAPPQSCTLASGLFSHGLLGIGLAGQRLPEAPWEDIEDFEGGLRLEWRWSRLSFALTGWAGYPDTPHLEILQEYTRNVDPRSGRPRRLGATGPCALGTEASCIQGGTEGSALASNPNPGGIQILLGSAYPGLARPDVADVRANHHANQQLFATICASTVGISDLVSGGCAFNLWNSRTLLEVPAVEPPTVVGAFSAMIRGDARGAAFLGALGRFPSEPGSAIGALQFEGLPLVPLHANRFPDPDGTPIPPFFNPVIDGGDASGLRLQAFPDVCIAPAFDCVSGLGDQGISPALTTQQEALVGCGDFWGTDCDIHGFDIFNGEASAMFQSWPGFEGAGGADWDPFDGGVAQPGTIGFVGGPTCTRYDRRTRETLKLPGCRGVVDVIYPDEPESDGDLIVLFEPDYDPRVDGCVFGPTVGTFDVSPRFEPNGPEIQSVLSFCDVGPNQEPIRTLYHPFAGCLIGEAPGTLCSTDVLPTRDFDVDFLSREAQVFRNELAALSWNLLMVILTSSLPPDVLGEPGKCPATFVAAMEPDDCSDRPPRFDEFDVTDPERLDGCSFRRPFLCKGVGPLIRVSGARRATVRAGGSAKYGRRDFLWHAGGVGVLDYTRRNVIGFSLDFPEDRTKTNWSFEFTWFDRVKMANNDEFDGLSTTQQFNLSVSIDRPTFVRFLNAGRTFLFNTQFFFQYIEGYERGMTANGPFNTIATLLAATAYHQDRLIPTLTLVHDFNSVSGAAIAGLTYRYTTHFSVGVGAAAFYGRVQSKRAALTGLAGPSGGAGEGRNRSYVENGLSSIRDRDELFLRFRYTF